MQIFNTSLTDKQKDYMITTYWKSQFAFIGGGAWLFMRTILCKNCFVFLTSHHFSFRFIVISRKVRRIWTMTCLCKDLRSVFFSWFLFYMFAPGVCISQDAQTIGKNQNSSLKLCYGITLTTERSPGVDVA